MGKCEDSEEIESGASCGQRLRLTYRKNKLEYLNNSITCKHKKWALELIFGRASARILD